MFFGASRFTLYASRLLLLAALLLPAIAAVVLGGVSLAGGRGGVFGPVVAVLILSLIRSDMTFLSLDTNLAVVAQGIILISVVMVGSLVQWRRDRG